MVNESELGWNYRQPVTQGLAVAHKKQAGQLLKNIMAHAKPKVKTERRPKGMKRSTGRKTNGLEADQKVHFGGNVKFW
jgi:hypothetical protein